MERYGQELRRDTSSCRPRSQYSRVRTFCRSSYLLSSVHPDELVIELSKEDTVYTIVANESEKSIAVSEYTAAGVNMPLFSPLCILFLS